MAYWITATVAILLACCRCAFALDPSLDVNQYAHTAWTIRDGFLKSGVRAIAQTPDGYLWLGTEFGLVRFDGARFSPWIPPRGQDLPSTNIRSLVAARDGTLWIGTLEGLASWNNSKLNRYAELAGQNVLTLLEDREGTVWAGAFGVPKGKLCAIHHQDVKCYGDDRSLGEWVWSLYEDAQGRLWAGAETGLWRWKPGPPKRYPMPHTIQTTQALAHDDNGAGVLAIAEGIWRFVNEKAEEYPVATPPGRFTPVNMFRDHDGGLWVGTLQGGLLHLYQGKTTVFAQNDGLSGDRILSLFEDREGIIWVGTADGLDRFRETTVFSISFKQGLSSPSVWSVLVARDNSVWLSTLDGLNRWNKGQVTIYRARGSPTNNSQVPATPRPISPSYHAGGEQTVREITDPALPDDRVGSLYEDERGRIWVSTPTGIARFERGRFHHVREVPGGWVNAITGDTHAGVWISYQDLGLVHWVAGRVVEKVPWSRLGGNVIASAVIPDPIRGGLWLGFFQGGLVHFKDGQVRASYAKSEGLGSGRVMGLHLDSQGTLWAATEGGLSRLRDGRIATLTGSNGLPCDTVHWAMEAEASFWLYTACGLLRVPRTELDGWAADPKQIIHFTTFDSSDGVISHALLTGYTPRVSQSADGRLWFAHFESVSVLDPHHLGLNKVPPPVHIEQITADGKAYDPSRGLRLPPLVRNLAIDYTALSFAAPAKVLFRYKLEGQDLEWREVVNDREVQYSNLPPGHYAFRVMACNNHGVWNQDGAILDFSIAPACYQTAWFRTLCALVVLALLWSLFQLRHWQIQRQFNMTLEARVGERTRIARELHDTLLQTFSALLLRLHSVSKILPARPEDAKQRVDTAIEQASNAIAEGRNAVLELRSGGPAADNLAQAIGNLGRELLSGSMGENPPEFRIQVEGAPKNLNPIVRDEAYRIAAEALRNALRHAGASQIEVDIRYDQQQLRLRIRDNGKGIDPDVLEQGQAPGHWGLRGMRERARLLDGNLEVWSRGEAGSGTEIELTVPAASAYPEPASPWSILLRSWRS